MSILRGQAAREARQIVIDLIRWELDAADGDRMAMACEKYGADEMRAALEKIADDLQRKAIPL